MQGAGRNTGMNSPWESRSGAPVVAAVGDLMLSGEWGGIDPDLAYGSLARALAADMIFANLETSIVGSEGAIEKEPRIFAEREVIAKALRAIGANVVTLANNHSFDGRVSGFEKIRGMLKELGIESFGAGANSEEASRPLLQTLAGIRIGWLGYASLGTDCPYVSSSEEYGINPLKVDKALNDITKLKKQVDHIVVSIHWGVEFCDVPSPEQVEVAHALIDAGASVILGHHAHVIQGVEAYRGGLIAYNLGNATTSNHRIGTRLAIRQTLRTRSSLLLRFELHASSVGLWEAIPIRCELGRVLVDDKIAAKYLGRANSSLRRGISKRAWRRRRLFEDVIVRTLSKLHPEVIRSLGPRHFKKLLMNLVSGLKGESKF